MAKDLGKMHLFRKIAGIDLYAAEAHFHDACYHRFFDEHENYQKKLGKNSDSGTEQAILFAAHNAAYNIVKEMLMTHVIHNKKVVALSHLRERYIMKLDS